MIINKRDSSVFLRHTIVATLGDENIDVRAYESIDSTNSEAKRYALEATERTPVLFVAKEQSAGRGRVGRSFVSRKNRGIYMTLLYFADAIEDTVSVTTHAAVATASAIEEVTGKAMKIKWVNDIFDEHGKVSGILVEGEMTKLGYAVAVGIGINIGESDFPDEIKDIASSLGDIGAPEGSLISLIARKLLAYAKNPVDKSFMVEYRARFMLAGKRVVLSMADGGEKHGKVVGVDDEGGLIIDAGGGREVIKSGSVSVRIAEGEL